MSSFQYNKDTHFSHDCIGNYTLNRRSKLKEKDVLFSVNSVFSVVATFYLTLFKIFYI